MAIQRPQLSYTPPRRAWLFVPGNRPYVMTKATEGAADAVIIDLEDAVPHAEKEKTRQTVVDFVDICNHENLYVRINALSTPYALDDISVLAAKPVKGIMLPKSETARDLQILDWLLSQYEYRCDRRGEQLEILPLIETGRGISNAKEIALSTNRIRRLTIGAADLTLDLGLNWSGDEVELQSYRSHIVVTSKVCGLEAPIDSAWKEFNNKDDMFASAKRAKDFGFQGKLCIHPKQVDATHQAYTPDAESVAQAKRIIEAFDQAETTGIGVVSVDGNIVDYPIVEAARRTLADAQRS